MSDASLCDDLFELRGIGPVCPRGAGLYEVYGPQGESLGFTHGGDPACSDCDGIALMSGTTPACVAATPNTYYVHVIYARASNDADRYASIVPTIRQLVADANAHVDSAGRATGSGLDIRVLCDNGVVVVENLVLPTSMSSDSFSTIVSDIRALGYNDGKQKYWVWYDDNTTCGCAGTGHLYTDESPGVGNLNNGNANSMFAVNFGFVSVNTWLHELGHNLGAVQDGAPYSSLAGHCIDGYDIMCYNDGGANSSGYSNSHCAARVFDCNKNTYCHATPAAGTYLATRWNVCGASQRFLERAINNAAPLMQDLVCSPAKPNAGETVSCSFHASDPGDNLSYSISWGDGTTATRVPASGFVASNASQSASHVYDGAGTFNISVSATDDRSPSLTSAPRNLSLPVSTPNAAPAIESLSCTSATLQPGASSSCTFVASDDSTGVRYRVEWGDGQTSFIPSADGYIAPGGPLRNASHAYSAVGNFSVNVSATDNATTPRTSAAGTAVVRVANDAPIMRSLTCTTTTLLPGDTATCSFNASDDSAGVRYRIDWGDGQTTDIPGTGHVAPGTMRSASHVYATAANFTVQVTATDSVPTPLTSAPRSTLVRVVADTTAPTLALTDPVDGYLYFGCGLEEAMHTAGILFVQRGCVRAVASDAHGVTRVEVRSRGQLLAQDSVAPYQMEFVVQNTELRTSYEVRAYDRSNNVRIVMFMADGIAPA